MASKDEIAIVGVGCRFPGADNLSEYWSLLRNGENHVNEIPAERWNIDAFYDADPNKPGKTYARRAGFISRYDEWDHRFFGISEMEASNMDPQQRMVLECVHMAMEDGGITKKQLDNTHTGVYIALWFKSSDLCFSISKRNIQTPEKFDHFFCDGKYIVYDGFKFQDKSGAINGDYKEHVVRDDNNLNSSYKVTGTNLGIISARVSYLYNLLGPAITVDTACSSSLVAIHLASQALKLGECGAAICGGVNLLMDPHIFVALSRARMLSPTGQCQAFSADADGYARSEGCGIVIIKRLSDAVSDGNKIWATLNTAVNQDGHSATPITAPSQRQQIDLLERTYKGNKINRDTIQVIEAHGTGTPIGDPVEANALGTFFSENNNRKRLIYIGSVKSNIGHLEGAAGVGGLIKVLLMMKNETIVPSLMYTESKENPKVNFKKYGFVVPTKCIPWTLPSGNIRTACVNSFGFGGTNAHAVVRDFPQKPLKKEKVLLGQFSPSFFIALSATDNESLKENVSHFLQGLTKNNVDLASLSYTTTCRRDHFSERKAVVVNSVDQLHRVCREVLNLHRIGRKASTKKKLVFVLCGVGTVWDGMSTFLLDIPPFLDAIKSVDHFLLPLAGWSIESKLRENEELLINPFMMHIGIFAYQIGLAALWKMIGIYPDAVIGQSVGEVAAAFIAGKLELSSAVQIVYHRSKLLSQVTGGTMAVTRNIPVKLIEDYCNSHETALNIAVYNSPVSCTVSGETEAIRLMKSYFESQHFEKGQVKELSVKCAYHSRHVEPVVDKLTEVLDKLEGLSSDTEIFSTVTGKKESGSCFSTGKYWGNNIRKPVLLSDAVRAALEPFGTTIFVEVGPGPVLQAHVHNLFDENTDAEVLLSVKYGQTIETLQQTVCKLYELGYNILWANIVEQTGIPTALPKYFFTKKRLLYQNPSVRLRNQGIDVEYKSHLYIERAEDMIEGPQFVARIDQDTTPFVFEHVFRGNVIVSGSFHADIGFEVGKAGLGLPVESTTVSVQFLRPIRVERHGNYVLSVTSKTQGEECLFSVKQGQTTVCKGKVYKTEDTNTNLTANDLLVVKQNMAARKHVTHNELYGRLEDYGFTYGPCYKVIKNCLACEDACLAEVEIPTTILADLKTTTLHPCVLDGLFQSVTTIGDIKIPDPIKKERFFFLPVAVEALSIRRKPVPQMLIYAKRINATVLETVIKLHYNVTLFDLTGNVIAHIANYTILSKIKSYQTPDELKHCLTWEPVSTSELSSNRRFLLMTNTSDKRFMQCLQSDHTVICHPKSTDLDYLDFVSRAMDSCEARWSSKESMDGIAVIFERGKLQEYIDKSIAEDIYQKTLNNCWLLVILIRYLSSNNIKKPLFLVTENAQSSGKFNETCSIDLCGAVIWGFVRSIMLEFVHSHITLVDLFPGLEETKTTLMTFMSGAVENIETTSTEIRICNNNISASSFSSTFASDLTPPFRLALHRRKTEYSIRSQTANYISGTHMLSVAGALAHAQDEEVRKCVQMRVRVIYIHPSKIYPLSQTLLNCGANIMLDLQQESHTVLGIEFTGCPVHSIKCGSIRSEPMINGFDKESEIVAVFPTEMASVVCIPTECTVSMKDLPFYENGLIVHAILAWTMSAKVPQGSKVRVRFDEADVPFTYLFKTMLVRHRKATVLEAVCENADVVFSLCSKELDYDSLRRTKYIVCLKHAIPADIYRRLVIKDKVKVEEIDATEIITQDKIPKLLETVVPWLKMNFCELKTEKTLEHEVGRSIETSTLPCMLPLNDVFDVAGTYIITGGLTGLGWELLLLLAEMGAGTIVTINRRALPPDKATKIDKIKTKHGCKILSFQVDVNTLESVTNLIKELQSTPEAGQIRGIFHGAGVLDSTLLIKVKRQQLDNVMRAKILGTMNLHIATKNINLDFFVLQSSITSIIGQPCQGNYGAANAFLDIFALWRRSKGLPAQAINWGALSIGMAANIDFLMNFEKRGFHLLTLPEIRSCFQQAIMQDSTGVIYTSNDWNIVARDYISPHMARIKLKMENVLREKSNVNLQTDNPDYAGGLDIQLLREADQSKQREALTFLVQAVAKRVIQNDKESYSLTSTFGEIGLDSMSSVTFANVVYDMTRCRMDPHFMLDPTRSLYDVVAFLLDNIFKINEIKDDRKFENIE